MHRLSQGLNKTKWIKDEDHSRCLLEKNINNLNLNSDQEEKKKIYMERMKVYQSLTIKPTMTPNDKRKTSSVDYLQEFRIKRNQESITERQPKYDWKAELSKKNIESSIKEQRIKNKANVTRRNYSPIPQEEDNIYEIETPKNYHPPPTKNKILHNQALHKERMLKANNEEMQVEDIDEMNDLLFESLEAKLSLLNDFSQKM